MENQIEEKKSFWQKIWANKTSRIIFVAIILILISAPIALGYYSYKYYQQKQNNELVNNPNTNASISSTPTASGSVSLAPAKTTTKTPAPITIDANSLKLVTKQSGYCKALAPEDWAIISNAQASGVDVFSPDKSLHAGWGISFVYNYMYADENAFLNYWMPLAGFDGFSMGNASDMGYGFTKRDFTSSNKKGIIFYKKYDVPDLGGYVMSVYMADTTTNLWDTKGASVQYSAISLRCTTQLRPTTSSLDLEKSDPSSESDNPEISLSDKWQEAIMGYENVYSPSTGEHYEAPTNSYWETGPSGAGYYRSIPNGYEKLERGFGSY